MLWGSPLTENEWDEYANAGERIWQESLKEPEQPPALRITASAFA